MIIYKSKIMCARGKYLFSILARLDQRAERENREKMKACDASRKESDL